MSHNAIPVLAERMDIHKSCKSLETVVNVLNDYCEAASAIVVLQKKLSKALRETAAMKCNTDIVVNTLTTSATIFESLTEVDSKFVKVADKECDGLSTEVRKWFKKLAKEEKTHDERIATANARIKQAGQNYEKKAKKNARDAVEEHTRYINLLSALGPEISQEKYNHSLFVTNRHVSTTCNVAACLARVADAEWLRYCEGVRRFAPSIGRLGEWKSFCEAGWTGNPPPDLPTADTTPPRFDMNNLAATLPTVDEENSIGYASLRNTNTELQRCTVDPYQPSPKSNSPRLATPIQFPTTDGLSDPSRGSEDRKNTLASLDHFPSPPTHYPIPPVASAPSSPTKQLYNDQPDRVRQFSSPQPITLPLRKVSAEGRSVSSRTDSQPQEVSIEQQSTMTNSTSDSRSALNERNFIAELSVKSTTGEHASHLLSDTPNDTLKESSLWPDQPGSEAADFNEQEFGIQKSQERTSVRAQTVNMPISQTIERSDSIRRNGSVVAAMRNRFAQNPSGSPQSPTRESPGAIPRSPISVTNIASRYQSMANTTPEQSSSSLVTTRRRGSLDTSRMPETFTQDQGDNSGRYPNNNTVAPQPDDIALRRKRIEELEELEIREQKHQLRVKEREIEQKSLELGRERARLMTAASAKANAAPGDSPNESLTRLALSSPVQRQQQHSPNMMSRPRYSYSTTHLVPIQPQTNSRSQSRSVSPVKPSSQSTADSFIPYAAALPVENLARTSNKPKGWIRRLSMPVISSFDSSKKSNNIGVASQPWRNSLALPEVSRDGRFGRTTLEKDVFNGNTNGSTTNFRG